MDLHHLKVVKFNSSLEKISNSIGVFGDVAKNTKCIVINECELNKKINNNYADNHKRLKIQRPFIIYRSKSEPLKVIPKEKWFRKHMRRKAISFDEIKKNFTYKHTFKATRLPKLMKRKEYAKRNQEIKVLFAREVSRLTKKDRNVCCSMKQRNTKVGTFTEKSNASYDIFGFQNRKHSFDHPSKQYRCDKGCITKKFSKLQLRLNKINKLSQPRNKPKSVTERQPFKFLKTRSSKLRLSKSESNCCLCNIARHYNLICFPENNISLQGKNIVSPKNTPICPSAYFRDCSCKDQQVSVTPSHLQTRIKPLGDAAVATSGSLCNNCIKSTRGNYASRPFCRIRRIPKSTRRGQFLSHTLGTTKKIFPKELLRYHGSKVRTFLKCVLLVLVIIAWIPCIITVLLCWILTYPLRPHYIKTNGCKNDECLHKRTPLSQKMNAVKCLADKGTCSIKAMLSLLRSNDEDFLQHRQNTRSRGCPDPKKKYTLFYTDHRGWRIKPIREKNIGVYDCDQQAFHNPNLKTINNNNFVKHKCCGCKLHNVEKNIKGDTSPYHREIKFKNQSQNTKCCKCITQHRQRLNGERNSPEYQINRPRIRSKSHPLPYDSHEKQPVMFSPCLRNSLSSPFPLNMTVARRKRKNKFTRHHLPSRCEPCKKWKGHKWNSKSANQNMKYTYFKTNKKLHTRCACGSKNHYEKKKSYFKILWYFIRSSYARLEKIIEETEDVAWKEDIKCDTYLDTLEQKPCPWINRRCPAVYPCITVWVKCIKSTWHMAVYTLSFCVWCPVMCCCYVFSELFWQCLK